MSVNLRYPNITAGTEREQISQIKSYLHQLVEQLNFALPSMSGSGAQTFEVQGAEMSYYDLRSLIMQELHEVQTTFDQLTKRFETDYVKNSGWEAGMHLATDDDGIVVAVDNGEEVNEAVSKALEEAKGQGGFVTDEEKAAIASQAASKISFTLDEEGNLYYEVLEE